MTNWVKDVIRARYLVFVLGESSSPRWWSGRTTSRIDVETLATILENIGEARAVHDVQLNTIRVVHLFRLPTDDEIAIHDVLRNWQSASHSFLQELASLQGREAYLAQLRQLAGRESLANVQGPVYCGAINGRRQGDALARICTAYLSGFLTGTRTFPYLGEAELSANREQEKETKRRQAEATRIAKKKALVARLHEVFESDFLSADDVRATDSNAALISDDEYDRLKARFVRDWAARELNQMLDPDQAGAVAATKGNVLVLARAGSGKTTTLVTRAIFLQKHCRVPFNALILLAFNKKAAEEMKDRLAKAIGKDLPHVMTFHALAHALVHPEDPLIHPNWIFLRIFGDNIDAIEDEERRLFYVAITRAKDSLSLMTESIREIPYLGDIYPHDHIDSLQWDTLPPVPSLDGARLEVRVLNAYDVRDQLKDLKYRWNFSGKYWQRAFLAEGFSFESLLNQPWARAGVRIEVYSETGDMLHMR